ncbi:hypothetical protein [Streptomyces sp. NPDC046985]|uniref:RNA polymerase sigma factor n=1 Tax=Streptomyces sp. NPDC046985 TaxID=3155377 RepID=UPI0033C0C280
MYVYVPNHTEGRTVTDRHANPLPAPAAGGRVGATAALTRTQPRRVTAHGVGVAAETPAHDREPLTPAQCFDALHAFCAPALVRQAYLLTGRQERAHEAVEQAFRLAWLRWPEVAHDRDPAGWVRAATYECALSPWRRFRPRRPLDRPTDPALRALQEALLALPPSYLRTLVLYDGVGLDLPETAAETEASTPAAANRLMHAREAVAVRLPDLRDPAELHRRLVRLGSAGQFAAAAEARARMTAAAAAEGTAEAAGADLRALSGATATATALRTAGERSTRFWTRSTVAFTAAIIAATALTLHTAPTHYLAPVSPGHAIGGPPATGLLGPLSQQEQKLRAELRRMTAAGPERLSPEAE